jgi:prepilin-type N-terminal cleavage/methylation domain-containing protein
MNTPERAALPRDRSHTAVRRGMTLVEVLIALTLLAVIGVGLTSVMRSQLRFADSQVGGKDAREVSRSALNALSTDIRMVDADSGIIVATRDSFTVLAPYAAGIICGPGATGGTVIALIPYDSVSYAEGGHAGYAYIDTTTTGTNYTEVYQYLYNTTPPTRIDSATAATTTPCLTASDQVGVFRQGAVVVFPAAPAWSRYQAAMLFRRVTYAFRSSTAISGRRGLFRTITNSGRGSEELVAPFGSTAGFRYYLNTGATVDNPSGAALRQIRGIELRLDGASEYVIPGQTAVTSAPMTTAIFFKNRPVQ